MAHSSPEMGKCVFFYVSLLCVRDCCVSFRAGEMFRKGNPKLQAVEVCSEQNTTFYQRASSRFDLPTSLFVERGYMLVEDLIKLEKLSGFCAHNNLLQVWHRNTHFQKQMQAKDSSSEFNWFFQSDYLREKAACTYEAEGEGLQRSGWQRWFLLWQTERKTVNSSAVKHKGVLKENRKFPTDTTFTKLVPGSCSLPNCRDRD